MARTVSLRELLYAQAALSRGDIPRRDIAHALQSRWEAAGEGLPFLQELRRISSLSDAALRTLDRDVHRLQAGLARRATAHTRPADITTSSASTGPEHQRPPEVHSPPPGRLRTARPARYREFDVAGEGGMGVVYMALDTELSRMVAFKMIRPLGDGSRLLPAPLTPIQAEPPKRDTPAAETFDELEARFLQEAWITGSLEHPGVVPVYELGRTPRGMPYYTMRFVRGQKSLRSELDRVRQSTIDERLELLDPFLKLCDTIAYAHARGVIHRDIKPDNVALGEFGEVVLLDWGLAKLEGREDATAAYWKDRLHDFRDIRDLRTLSSGIGTPGYMAPEAAMGAIARVGERSDLYSLGVILYEILTAERPYSMTGGYREYVRRITEQDAPPADTKDARVPPELADICRRTLARNPCDRPARATEIADGIRRWKVRSLREREVQELLVDARDELATARSVTREPRLAAADRAAYTIVRAALLMPDRPALTSLRAEAEALRALARDEVERMRRRRFRRRAAAVALLLLAVAGALIAERMHVEAKRLIAAREESLLLRDSTQLALLIREEPALWPLDDRSLAPRLRAWLDGAEAQLLRRPRHEATLASSGLSSRTARHVRHVLEQLDRCEDPRHAGGGLVAAVRRRLRRVRAIQAGGVPGADERWRRCLQALRSSPRYTRLPSNPRRQQGLVPLGPDPASGLEEFAVLGSGTIPSRNALEGRLILPDDFAIVLVLLPGGRSWVGAQADDPRGMNYDTGAMDYEGPPQSVVVTPFFLSKFEVTRAQWAALRLLDSKPLRGRQAVGDVQWDAWTRWLERSGLRLPTESEWEYGSRAGTSTATWCEAVGIALEDAEAVGLPSEAGFREVGSKPLGANPFGLHDVLGNVQEACLELSLGPRPYDEAPMGIPAYGRYRLVFHMVRGVQYNNPTLSARSSRRSAPAMGAQSGARPAREFRTD